MWIAGKAGVSAKDLVELIPDLLAFEPETSHLTPMDTRVQMVNVVGSGYPLFPRIGGVAVMGHASPKEPQRCSPCYLEEPFGTDGGETSPSRTCWLSWRTLNSLIDVERPRVSRPVLDGHT